MHRPTQRFAEASRRRLLWIGAGRVHRTALDENAHENDEQNGAQHANVPEVHHVLLQRVQCVPVEEQVFQPHQRPLGVDRPAPQEHVTVALEVVARRARPQRDALGRQAHVQAELAGAAARGCVVAVLAGQLAQPPLVDVLRVVRREEALGHVPQQANGAGAVALDAQLRAVVALGFVVARLRLRALGRRAVARGAPRALGLLLALLVLVRRHELARVQAARALRRAALRLGAPCAAARRLVHVHVGVADLARIAALVLALVVVEAAVALLADLDDFVAAEGALRHGEAVSLLRVLDGVQHIGNVADGAGGEFAVVRPIAAGRAGEHDVVAAQAARTTFLRIIVLRRRSNKVDGFMRTGILMHKNRKKELINTGDPKLWPISWARVSCDTFGGTRLL